MLIVIIALHGLIGCALPNRQPILVVPRLCAYARHHGLHALPPAAKDLASPGADAPKVAILTTETIMYLAAMVITFALLYIAAGLIFIGERKPLKFYSIRYGCPSTPHYGICP
jgi:hypothetical protein